MKKAFLKNLIVGFIAVFVLVIPNSVFAIELNFKRIATDDGSTIIEARVDPESKNINVVEGIISFKETPSEVVSSVLIETGGSVLTFWPTLPVYSTSEKRIRFTGGTPGGFNEEGLLFRMSIFASQTGDVTISWIGGSAHVNDGKGTNDGISARSITMSLTENESSSTNDSLVNDFMPPHFDFIEVGRDPGVYSGEYFISFQATDDISGIARYAVIEGQIVTDVTANGIYIFRDQTRKTPVTITAYDIAGNAKSVEIPGKHSLMLNIILLILSLGIVLSVLKYRHKIINDKNVR